MKRLMIRVLLRLFPAAWRAEFGPEFEDVLLRTPVTMAMVMNVAVNGCHERLLQKLRQVTGGGGMDAEFHARYDKTTRIITAAAAAVIISLPLLTIGFGMAFIGSAVLTLLVVGLGFAYSPRGYGIQGGVLRVKRLAGDVVIPLDRLRYVRPATAQDFAGCVRLWGSGGLFGYYGSFWSKALGRSQWYVTDRSKAVVLADAYRVVVVSPSHPDAFVAAITANQSLSLVVPEGPQRSGVSPTLVFATAFSTVVLGFVAWALWANPGRPPVDLTRDALTIQSKFYAMTVPSWSVDVARVRVVDLSKEPGWRPVMRTNGFGNLHYSAGSFRTANGRDVKLYTTGSRRLVLLPPSGQHGRPVLLDTADPDKFVARLQTEWGHP